MNYVYLISPFGVELIGKGSFEECVKIKYKKDKKWQKGDLWFTVITDEEREETNYFD